MYLKINIPFFFYLKMNTLICIIIYKNQRYIYIYKKKKTGQKIGLHQYQITKIIWFD